MLPEEDDLVLEEGFADFLDQAGVLGEESQVDIMDFGANGAGDPLDGDVSSSTRKTDRDRVAIEP